jgi:hypothetical protein
MAGVQLAGGLLKMVENINGHDIESYVGMLVGRFGTYGLSVFGGYTNDNGNPSFFVFGGVNGPIGGPPAFFLTGIGGGLGINRGLRIPTDLSQFASFPFIQALDPAASPPDNMMDALRSLNAYFPVQSGSFWFAAGISFTSFALVDGVAVVAVAFGNGLTIDLLGLARLALPRPGAALVSIELALLAHFSTSEGVFLIKAQLTDNSWLLYEDVRLTGGFAFAVWWKGSLAGQFVLTMGGYHPSFHREGYPDVPRLGIMWRISDFLVIKGESYFALTSEAVMAGVGIQASLDFGWVWASLEFGGDAIVYFDPFWYEASAYARISAGITIDLGFLGTISISATLGATVRIWGPDFAGHAEFEIGPCTVPVDFGSPKKVPAKQLVWTEFVDKYLEGANGTANALSAITGKGTLPAATGGQAGAPSSDGTKDLPFLVFAEFEISFTTSIPATEFLAGNPHDVNIVQGSSQPAALGLSPMGAKNVASRVIIGLGRLNSAGTDFDPVDAKLLDFIARVTTDAYPVGVWGAPKDPNADVKPLPTGDVITAGKSLTLVAGIKAPTVGPEIDYYQVTASRRPLPLLATGSARANMLVTSAGVGVAVPTSVAAAVDEASALMFADRRVDGVARVRGGHSMLAEACFRQDRSAPPMFGTLTDGLAVENGDAGPRTPLDPVRPDQARRLRAPHVAGYFTAGTGAAVRPDATTVSDQRLKRRAAPTIDSVHSRLSVHLPVSLSRMAPPAAATEATVVASVVVPRTDAPGSMRSFRGSGVGSPSLQSLVGGLGPVSRELGAPLLRPGDVVVLQFPDASFDVDVEERPIIDIAGSARIVSTAGRTVLGDADVRNGAYAVPLGATHVSVQASGSSLVTDGYAGWHGRSTVARIGSLAAMASGCVLAVDATSDTKSTAWDTAASLVEASTQVTTRFAHPATFVGIALTGVQVKSLAPTELFIDGGSVVSDANGLPAAPVAVTLGDTCVLLYRITAENGPVSIRVTEGADWQLSGVFAGTGDVEEIGRRVARLGLSRVTGRVVTAAGGECSVSVTMPEAARAVSPRRAKRATAKKATAKKSTAKKSPRAKGRTT